MGEQTTKATPRRRRNTGPARWSSGGYSRDFTPHGDTGKRYMLDAIPAGFWTEVRAKAKREGVSLRALILKLLKDWLEAK